MNPFRKLVWMGFILAVSIMALSSSGAASKAEKYVIVAWNNLGMHCYDRDFSVFAILPPFNTLFAQVIKVGDPPQIITDGITVNYGFPENTYSADEFADFGALMAFLLATARLLGKHLMMPPGAGSHAGTPSARRSRSRRGFRNSGSRRSPIRDRRPLPRPSSKPMRFASRCRGLPSPARSSSTASISFARASRSSATSAERCDGVSPRPLARSARVFGIWTSLKRVSRVRPKAVREHLTRFAVPP